MNKVKSILKKAATVVCVSISTFFMSSPVFAENTVPSGNPITQTNLFQGVVKLLSDLSLAVTVLAPIVCGLIIAAISLLIPAKEEENEKIRLVAHRKKTISALIWIFSVSSVIVVITTYFKP